MTLHDEMSFKSRISDVPNCIFLKGRGCELSLDTNVVLLALKVSE